MKEYKLHERTAVLCPACRHQPFLQDAAGDGYVKVCCTNPDCLVRPSTPPFHLLDAIRHWNSKTAPDVRRRGFTDLTRLKSVVE